MGTVSCQVLSELPSWRLFLVKHGLEDLPATDLG